MNDLLLLRTSVESKRPNLTFISALKEDIFKSEGVEIQSPKVANLSHKIILSYAYYIVCYLTLMGKSPSFSSG